MKIILSAFDVVQTRAWDAAIKRDDVEVYLGDIFELAERAEVVVSPANSFGFMDGGLDLQYSSRIGWHLQKELQEHIQECCGGELLVGQAFLMATDVEDSFPYLVSAPTMRVPLNIEGTVNAYLATRAALFAVLHYNQKLVGTDPIETIAFPAMGTGVGRLHPDVCALQMGAAIESVLDTKGSSFPTHLGGAVREHLALGGTVGQKLGSLKA